MPAEGLVLEITRVYVTPRIFHVQSSSRFWYMNVINNGMVVFLNILGALISGMKALA